MSRLDTTLQNLPTIVKYALVIGVVVFISTLFPNQNKFSFSFAKGEVWSHEDLYAPFDLQVKKSQAELDSSKKELKENSTLYFSKEKKIVKERKEALKKAFDLKIELEGESYSDASNNPDIYLQQGYKILDEIYKNKGVFEWDKKNEAASLQFIQGGNSTEIEKNTFFSSKQANAEAVDALFQSRLVEGDIMMSIFEKSFFQPNIIYNDSLTNYFLQDQLSAISIYKNRIEKNDLIISKGETISEEHYEILKSLRNGDGDFENQNDYSWTVFIGYLLLTSLIVGVYLFYLQFNAEKIFNKYSSLIFMLLWLAIYSYLVYAVERTETLNAYMIPFCIAPIVLKSFFDERVALFTHIVIILIASILSSQGYEFTFLQLLAGIVAVLTPIENRDWSKFFYFLLTIFVAYALGFTGLSLIQNEAIASLDWSTYGWIFWSVFLTLLAYPLIPLLERIFGFTSSITLMELSDINKPLLKKLAEEAPGTFQHSLQVANLAEAAATKINAKALLVKVGALYHDIGKMNAPSFYIENQKGKNPHDSMEPLKSAQIIIEHITEGVKMAKKNRLNSEIIDFIKTHHGTTRVEYFFQKHKKLNPTQINKEPEFRYAGPIPTSKEETILLLADSIEAAAKSLKNYDEHVISDLVDKIVGSKIAMGQLANSELTFEELEICKKEFKRVLNGIHHARIEYPQG